MVPPLGWFLQSPSAEEQSPSSQHSYHHHHHTQPCSLFLSFLSNSPVFPVERTGEKRPLLGLQQQPRAQPRRWGWGQGWEQIPDLSLDKCPTVMGSFAPPGGASKKICVSLLKPSNKPTLNPHGAMSHWRAPGVFLLHEVNSCSAWLWATERFYELVCSQLGNSVQHEQHCPCGLGVICIKKEKYPVRLFKLSSVFSVI